ncbi:uncharacterized protein KY384_005577 [Bacidia gigantensis]|uniref:uncharacterized protein n=1 Tax=Bacidia gigantensis TaxID=2732470 RepID=UPI001D0438A6|nr:uncharacterized protein KY384_005577 [Bacidia gigantensis]KAG8530095.1 hypothetical protein KY384_005577 [Bacidia gigantensis]
MAGACRQPLKAAADNIETSPSDPRLDNFKNVDDLSFLRNSIRASSIASAAFHEDPVQVVNHVAWKLPKELQQTIHAVAASLCSPNLDVPLIEEDLLFNRETSYNTTTEVEDALAPISFDLPLPVLKQILELAHRIQLLSTLFLNTYIKRLNNLQPQHLAKPGFVFSSYPFRKYPDGRKYQPPKSGPASWSEEYRVLRALWRLQLFCLISKPNSRVTNRLNVEASYIECSIPYRQHELSRILSHLTNWELDEMICVHEYLDGARISLRAPPSVPHEDPNCHTPTTPSTPSSTSTNNTQPIFPIANARPSSNPTGFGRFNDLIAVKRSTEAYNFFHRYGLRHPTSPLQRSCWENFRTLGFGIWDQERLCHMEMFRMPAALRDQKPQGDLSIDDVGFTWKSVEAQAQKALEDLYNGRGSKKANDAPTSKGISGLKGLMRSKTKVIPNGSSGSSPRSSAESFRAVISR